MHIVKEKRFYINLLTITIPIALQNLISFATSMMDTIMLGRADDTGVFLSASSLANQPFFILSLVCFGLAGASTVLSAQYWGKRDTASIRSIYSIILKVAFVISTFMALAVLIFPQAVMGIYSNNDEIIAAGISYLRIPEVCVKSCFIVIKALSLGVLSKKCASVSSSESLFSPIAFKISGDVTSTFPILAISKYVSAFTFGE